MRRLLLVVVLVAVAALLVTRAEPLGPAASLETPVDVIGRATLVRVLGRDRGTGLASLELRLVPGGGGAPVVLAREEYLRRTWRGSGIHSALLTATVDAGKVPEGPGTLEVWATDHSWLAALRRGPRLTRPVTVDVTPPLLSVVSEERVARLGGAETVVYRVGPDTAQHGVQMGDEFFPGTDGLFTDPALRAALFAVPQNLPDARPVAVAVDGAGNRRTVPVNLVVRPRRFADKTLPLSDEFLARKVPELLQANGLGADGDLVAGYLRINRDLRASTELRVRDICRVSLPRPQWQGALLRLPDSAPLSGFADRRTYLYQGKPIDHQTHLGFDLASFRGSAVPAAAGGRVAFTGPLGIYGDTVVLDHGFGLFTLYGHLSHIDVEHGTQVGRGQTIGRTGDTGLAGGDHLHFSTMVHGVHVDPVEWWDAHWIQDHVERRLAAFPRVAPPAGAGA
jgi:murein DD-endopeptidase MepM/ murein hydrolase activator NlpD